MSSTTWEIATTAVEEHGALQKPAELAAFLDLLTAEEPAVIVEIGADVGGTLWAWQQLASKPRVVGVSLRHAPFGTQKPLNTTAEHLDADSHDRGTVSALVDLLAGATVDVVFIDGDHTLDGVTQDHYLYAPLVRPGGIIAFHDICRHEQGDVQVDQFWAALQAPLKWEIVYPPATWGGIGWYRR